MNKKVWYYSLVIWLIMFMALLVYVRVGAIDFPTSDDWVIIKFIELKRTTGLTFHDLWQPINNHRHTIGAFLLANFLDYTNVNLHNSCYLNAIMASLCTLLVLFAFKAALEKHSQIRAVPIRVQALTSTLIVIMMQGLGQAANITWAWQSILWFSILCSFFAMYIAVCSWKKYDILRVPALACLCTFSALSFGNGFLTFFIVTALLFLSIPHPSKRLIYAVSFLIISIAFASIYFWKHEMVVAEMDPASPRLIVISRDLPKDPLLIFSPLHVFGNFLGYPLAPAKMEIAFILGLGSAVLFTVLSLYWVISKWKSISAQPMVLFFIALGVYSLLAAAAVAAGRSYFFDDPDFSFQGANSRYVSFASVIWVGIIVLLILSIPSMSATHPRLWRYAAGSLPFIIVIMCVLSGLRSLRNGRDYASFSKETSLMWKTMLLMRTKSVAEECEPCLQYVDGPNSVLQETYRRDSFLREQKLSHYNSYPNVDTAQPK